MRLIRDDMPDFDECIETIGMETQVEQMPSAKYGIDTLYIKSVKKASVDSESIPSMPKIASTFSRMGQEVPDGLGDLVSREIFVLKRAVEDGLPPETGLYAWLSEDEIEDLKKPEKAVLSQAWLETLGFNEVCGASESVVV